MNLRLRFPDDTEVRELDHRELEGLVDLRPVQEFLLAQIRAAGPESTEAEQIRQLLFTVERAEYGMAAMNVALSDTDKQCEQLNSQLERILDKLNKMAR